MFVISLEVTDFRNYQHAALDFGPGCSILVGPNGQGKTNLIEAVGYAATLGSHRVAADAPLIRFGAERALIQVVAGRDSRRAALDLLIGQGKPIRARINGSPLPRARDCLGLVRAVTFAPEDLALIKGDPSERRRFLDDLLVQRAPRWAGVIADVDRVLRQRGALLRAVAKKGGRPDGSDLATLDVWDDQLAHYGGQLWAARAALLDAVRGPFAESYLAIAGAADNPVVQYRSSTGPGEPPGDESAARAALKLALPARHAEEFRRGVNLTGPHRDDIEVLVNELPAKGYASHGESWSLALALRLAAYRVLTHEAIDGGDPILILDDVFAELDESRRTRLAEQVATAEQVLITAAVEQDVPPALAGARFTIRSGQIRPDAA